MSFWRSSSAPASFQQAFNDYEGWHIRPSKTPSPSADRFVARQAGATVLETAPARPLPQPPAPHTPMSGFNYMSDLRLPIVSEDHVAACVKVMRV